MSDEREHYTAAAQALRDAAEKVESLAPEETDDDGDSEGLPTFGSWPMDEKVGEISNNGQTFLTVYSDTGGDAWLKPNPDYDAEDGARCVVESHSAAKLKRLLDEANGVD